MKYIIVCAVTLLNTINVYSQEILLKGDSTSMVNLYGDAKLLSIEMQKTSKVPATYTANGYRIQLAAYDNRNDAEKTRAQFVKKYPKEFAIMKYDEPNYKVHIGNYITEEDANSNLEKYMRAYPQAIIIQDKIQITPKR